MIKRTQIRICRYIVKGTGENGIKKIVNKPRTISGHFHCRHTNVLVFQVAKDVQSPGHPPGLSSTQITVYGIERTVPEDMPITQQIANAR